MIPENATMGIFFFLQTVLGLLGNSSLLFHYLLSVCTVKSLMPKDLIMNHLTLANFLAIISRGTTQTVSELGLNLLDDIRCKLVIYIFRVARGTSMHTTCLLSCFQAIMISSSNTRWVKLKYRASKYVGPSCSLSWLVHMLLNITVIMRITGPSKNRNATNVFNFGYCSGFISGTIVTPLYFLILCSTDVLCLSLMAWASGSMVSILHKHKRQMQYMRSAHNSCGAFHQARAIQTILILVCIFVTFYSVSSIIVLYTAFSDNPRLWLMNIFMFLETCFPTFCPFLLISNNKSASRLYFSWRGKR